MAEMTLYDLGDTNDFHIRRDGVDKCASSKKGFKDGTAQSEETPGSMETRIN